MRGFTDNQLTLSDIQKHVMATRVITLLNELDDKARCLSFATLSNAAVLVCCLPCKFFQPVPFKLVGQLGKYGQR